MERAQGRGLRCGAVQFDAIAAVIFDKDGTLAAVGSFLRRLAQQRSRLVDAQVPGVEAPLLLAFGVEGDRLNPAGLMAVGTRQENEIAAAAYLAETGLDWLGAREQARSAFREADSGFSRKADHTPPLAGIPDLLQRLTTAGIVLGIASSDTTDNVVDFLERYELTAQFAAVMGADCGYEKPDPAWVLALCDRLGVPPRATVVIGDSAADLAMARAAGVGAIGATWGWSDPPRLTGADAIATTPSDLQVILG